jgi:hypothetical protein
MSFDAFMNGAGPEVLFEPWLDTPRQPDTSDAYQKVLSEMHVDGEHYFALLILDLVEHQRRQQAGIGHASNRLLHVLWGIPMGIWFPATAFDSYELTTLEEEGMGWVNAEGDSITRLYQPIGRIDMVAIVNTSLKRSVSLAASHPATTRRLAVWSEYDGRPLKNSSHDLAEAARLGIGVVAVGPPAMVPLIEPTPATVGRPAIYRWWQAEICYRNWLSSTGPIETTGNAVSPPW